MEQSTKIVDNQPTNPPIGESAPVPAVVPPTLPAFTKVDNNLTSIGFFTASSKRSRRAIEKTTVVIDQGIERQISILPSAKYGLPITADQDYWLALMKLVDEHKRQAGKITNPFAFTTAEILKILGQVDSGKNYKAVQEWLSVMNSTAVEGGTYNAARKAWYTDKTHAVDRVINVGKQLPDGTTADKNHIWFSQWQLDNINAGHLISVEMRTYTQLNNNIAKNLVPHLQEWLYASQHDGRFEKQYEDACQLLGIRTYRYRSQIEEQLGPSLQELLSHGYLSKWAIEPMADRKKYKLILKHGAKYHGDQQTRIEQKNRIKAIPAAGEQHRSPRPRQKPFQLQPEVDLKLLEQLLTYGITESVARRELAAVPQDYPIRDVLEWLTLELSKPHNIQNPAAFIISHLQRRALPPSTFESSQARQARQEAENAKRQRILDKQAIVDAAAEELRKKGEDELNRLKEQNPEHYQALFEQAKTEVFSSPIMAGKKYSPIHEGAIRFRMRQLMQPQPGQTVLPLPTDESPPAELVPTLSPSMDLHQATNQPSRQADPLQDLPPSAPVLNLETILKTPQLPPPAEPAAAVEQHKKLDVDLL